jgi:hypothetical protein
LESRSRRLVMAVEYPRPQGVATNDGADWKYYPQDRFWCH